MENRTPMQIIIEEFIVHECSMEEIYQWILKHGLDYEKTTLKGFYMNGYEDASRGFGYPRPDDLYYMEFPDMLNKD